MNTKTITAAEVAEMKISALPTRPTAPGYFGGKGYTAADMKSAFDKLPLYIIERLNSLIRDVSSDGEGSLVREIPTGIEEAPRLYDLISQIKSGELAAYLSLGDETLGERMYRIDENEAKVAAIIAELIAHTKDTVIDGASPVSRNTDNGEVKI